eukprot:342266-Pyramimonas_sp.AAC.1
MRRISGRTRHMGRRRTGAASETEAGAAARGGGKAGNRGSREKVFARRNIARMPNIGPGKKKRKIRVLNNNNNNRRLSGWGPEGIQRGSRGDPEGFPLGREDPTEFGFAYYYDMLYKKVKKVGCTKPSISRAQRTILISGAFSAFVNIWGAKRVPTQWRSGLIRV